MRIQTLFARLLFLGCLWSLTTAFGQGTIAFQNLDFEQAAVPSVPSGQYGAAVPTAQGLPGWTAYTYYPDKPDGTILHNDTTLSDPCVAILGPFWSQQFILQGNYTVFLKPSWPGLSIQPAIAQTATLPMSARSIQYTFMPTGEAPEIFVSFAGQALPSSIIGGTRDVGYTCSVDVSAFIGQTGELRFFGGGLLDDIRFSAVPEPSTLGLLALGGLLFARRIGKRESL